MENALALVVRILISTDSRFSNFRILDFKYSQERLSLNLKIEGGVIAIICSKIDGNYIFTDAYFREDSN